VTAYASLIDPDEEAWSTLPVRKKHKSAGPRMKKTGKFMLPISMHHRTGHKSGHAGTTKVTLYKPPPVDATENEHGEKAILKLRRVGKKEADELSAIEKSMVRAKYHNLDGRNAGCEGTKVARVAPVQDLTIAESSPPTSPLSSPSANVPVSFTRLKTVYPATRTVISEVRRHLDELIVLTRFLPVA